jgi:predicted GIY-YIG superfamily endonuclease
MAGLVPAIHVLQTHTVRGGWVYILANKPNGILYTGVTRDIAKRAWQHREGAVAASHDATELSGSYIASITTQSSEPSNESGT